MSPPINLQLINLLVLNQRHGLKEQQVWHSNMLLQLLLQGWKRRKNPPRNRDLQP